MDARPLEPLLAIGRVVRKRRSVLAHDVVERGEGVDGLHDAPQRRRLVWLEPARLHRRAYHCTRCTACAGVASPIVPCAVVVVVGQADYVVRIGKLVKITHRRLGIRLGLRVDHLPLHLELVARA